MHEVVTMTEAAKRLGISRVTLRRLVREGRLPLQENPLDKRQKLIPEEALEELATGRPPSATGFSADGISWNPDPPFARDIENSVRGTGQSDKRHPSDGTAERTPSQMLDRKFPRPESIGMVDDLGVNSDDVDAWLEASWRPC